MKTGKVTLGILAGAAVGALLGILFAPDKGSDTRRKISRKSSDAIDDIKDKATDLKSRFVKTVEEQKGNVENLLAKGNEKYREVKDAANGF